MARPAQAPGRRKLFNLGERTSIRTLLLSFAFRHIRTSDGPTKSGEVADCVTLVPNGKRFGLVELNLTSQLLFHVKTDLFEPDVIPLAFTRTYYPVDRWSQKFRIYLPNVYDPYLTGSRFPYTYSDWLLPDRRRIHFGRISSGTGFAD